MAFIFIFVILFLFCDGFLINNTPSPHTGHEMILTENHFNMLMDLIMEERKMRGQLEQYVNQLQNQLDSTKLELANMKDTFTEKCSCDGKENINDTNLLRHEIYELKNNYSTIQDEYNTIVQKQSIAEASIHQLETQALQIGRLQSVNDIKVVLRLENKTNNFERELKNTNNKLTAVVANSNARANDILAVVHKMNENGNAALEHDREIKLVNNKLSTVVSDANHRYAEFLKFYNDTKATDSKVSTVNKGLETHILNIEKKVNTTEEKLGQISNYVGLTTCAIHGADKYIAIGEKEVIPFKSIRTSSGINNSSSITEKGKFTTEKAGLYLISVVISSRSNTNGGYYEVMKNNDTIAAGHRDPEKYVVSSTTIVLNHLHIGDIVYVQSGVSQSIDNSIRSCLTIVQIKSDP